MISSLLPSLLRFFKVFDGRKIPFRQHFLSWLGGEREKFASQRAKVRPCAGRAKTLSAQKCDLRLGVTRVESEEAVSATAGEIIIKCNYHAEAVLSAVDVKGAQKP